MKTLILAGGYGTRIRDVTNDIPKPMIPIGNRPVLWHIMKSYSQYGIKDFVLCLGYKSDIIKDYFLNYGNRQNDFTLDLSTQQINYHNHHITEDWCITFAETGQNSQTGARIFRVKKYLEKEECFMLTYGDGVSNINIAELIKYHKAHGKLLTVTGGHPPGRFGELEVDGNQVVGFNEKPQATEGWISAGFFVCNKAVLDYLTPEEDLIWERHPVESIVNDGQMMVYKHDGFWHPMDTSRDYKMLNQLWEQDKAPWKTW
jgi:glucose-1-phosphate cytidylyltransferase